RAKPGDRWLRSNPAVRAEVPAPRRSQPAAWCMMRANLDVFAAALHALDDGRGAAIATVTAASGSTPRHLGARMVVASDGEQWGTVGGGRIEQLCVVAAREVAGGAAPRVVRQHLVRDLAMCCGGSMAVAITPAAPSREALAKLAG